MNIHEISNAIQAMIQEKQSELGIAQEAIYIIGETIGSISIPERISIQISPKENIHLEHFHSSFWKCTLEIMVYSPTFFRCMDIVTIVTNTIRQKTTFALSQTKIQTKQTTAQSTVVQLMAQIIIELA